MPVTSDTWDPFVIDLLLGGISAFIARTAIAPFKNVRAALEFQKRYSTHGLRSTPYTGVLNCLIRMPKEHGFLSLWKGNLMSLCLYVPVHAFNFAFRNWFRSHIPKNVKDHSEYNLFMRDVLTGGLAATSTQFIMHPFLICHYMAVTAKDRPTNFKRFSKCMKRTARNRGIAGFYQGFYGFTIALSLYRGLYYSLYDSGKIRLRKYNLESSMLAHFAVAQVNCHFSHFPWQGTLDLDKLPISIYTCCMIQLMATATAGFIVYPMDHTAWCTLEDSKQSNKKRKYRGILDCWRKTFYAEGPIAFYAGCLTNLLRTTVTALVLVLYDEFDSLRSD